jgi:hypothetical protein
MNSLTSAELEYEAVNLVHAQFFVCHSVPRMSIVAQHCAFVHSDAHHFTWHWPPCSLFCADGGSYLTGCAALVDLLWIMARSVGMLPLWKGCCWSCLRHSLVTQICWQVSVSHELWEQSHLLLRHVDNGISPLHHTQTARECVAIATAIT